MENQLFWGRINFLIDSPNSPQFLHFIYYDEGNIKIFHSQSTLTNYISVPGHLMIKILIFLNQNAFLAIQNIYLLSNTVKLSIGSKTFTYIFFLMFFKKAYVDVTVSEFNYYNDYFSVNFLWGIPACKTFRDAKRS